MLSADLRRRSHNAYLAKADLSVFMLLPALWWQAQGRTIAKKDSFPTVYAQLPPEHTETFHHAAELRVAWRYREPALNRWLRRLWINPLLPEAIDAARAGRPPQRPTQGFLDAAKAAVRELVQMEARYARNSVA